MSLSVKCVCCPDVCLWVCTELQEVASQPERDSKTLSSDLIEYVQHMVREHKDDYKVGTRRPGVKDQTS